MIKTRFAPSPTGYLHVGGLRTALYAYLFARKNEGTFVLRIEDTDQNRLVEGAAEKLMESLEYFGLTWDEGPQVGGASGPYFQSQRTELYRKHLQTLLDNGHAYRCFCTPERLDKMREEQKAKKQIPKYDRHCLELSEKKVDELLSQGKKHVVRLKVPQKTLEFHDVIRGDLSFHGKDIDDQVLLKSDGYPTYHLANVVDDHEMGITHVIRGEEWVPSTPKHIWLYQAFGWTPPQFAHLPLLLNADRSKLSKRQGDVAAEDYAKKGYLKEALLNFIALLGWNPGSEEEFFSLPELAQAFSLERVQKAGAVFSLEKLDWFNGQYLRKKSAIELGELLLPILHRKTEAYAADRSKVKTDWFKQSAYTHLTADNLADLANSGDEAANTLLKYTNCVQTRMKTLSDGPDMLRPFLLDELNYDLKLFEHEKMKIDRSVALMALENSLPALEKLEDYESTDSIKAALVAVIQELGVKNGHILWPLRVALSNEQYSPGTMELIHVLGKELTVKRVQAALKALQD